MTGYADNAELARRQERHEGQLVEATTPSRFFAPGTTPAMRELIMVRGDIARHERLLASETEFCRAHPNKWEISRVKARMFMLAEAKALAGRLEARIVAEARAVAA